jgi:hypothetical protein
MPRFRGRNLNRFWVNVVAVIVLALVVIFVLEISGTTHIFT